MKKCSLILLWLVTTFASVALFAKTNKFTRAQLSSPVGYWLTIDDKSNRPRAVVHLYMVGKELRGDTMAGLYIPGQSWGPTCDKCIAPWTDKPIHDLTFMWNFFKSGKTWDSTWVDGKIFDVSSKKDIYRSKLWLIDQGKKIKVRGYVFVFYRTQTWIRLTHHEALGYVELMKEQRKKYPFTD